MLGGLAVDYEVQLLTATEFAPLRLLTLNASDLGVRFADPPVVAGTGRKDPDQVRAFITQLRRQPGDDPSRPRWILNERGVGYCVPGPEE